MEADFWLQLEVEKNLVFGSTIAFVAIAALANLDWRSLVRVWVGKQAYPNPSRIRIARGFLAVSLVAMLAELGSQLLQIGQTQPDILPSLIIAAAMVSFVTLFYLVARFISGARALTDAEINRKLPAVYSTRIVDDVIYNDRVDGEVETVTLTDVIKVSVQSKRAGLNRKPWLVIHGKQGHRVSFPMNANGVDAVLYRLKDLPGFLLRAVDVNDDRDFECWSKPNT